MDRVEKAILECQFLINGAETRPRPSSELVTRLRTILAGLQDQQNRRQLPESVLLPQDPTDEIVYRRQELPPQQLRCNTKHSQDPSLFAIDQKSGSFTVHTVGCSFRVVNRGRQLIIENDSQPRPDLVTTSHRLASPSLKPPKQGPDAILDFRHNLPGGVRYQQHNLFALRGNSSNRLVTDLACQLQLKANGVLLVSPRSIPTSSQIQWSLYFGFADPRIHQKNYLRCQTFPISIWEQQGGDGSWYIPRTLVIASTTRILGAARDKVNDSLSAAAARHPESDMSHATAFIGTESAPHEVIQATLSFLHHASPVLICSPRFAVDFLTADIVQVYWLNLKLSDLKNIQKLMDRFDAIKGHTQTGDPLLPTAMKITISLGKEDLEMARMVKSWLQNTRKTVTTDLNCVERLYREAQMQDVTEESRD